jgi:inosine-uridine nucleoside N-ribohydrolase
VDLGNDHGWSAEGLVPDLIASQSRDVPAAVTNVLEQSEGLVGWVGLGPMSNLARLLDEHPGIGGRLVVTQQEGGADFSQDGAQRNIELDTTAARRVFAAGIEPWIVPATVSFHMFNMLTVDSIEYTVLDGGIDPARILLRLHLDLWFATFSKYVALHGPITLAHSVGMPFLAATSAGASLDDIGRLAQGDEPVHLAQSADYDVFRRWLVDRLKRVESKLARHPAVDYDKDV